MMAVLLAGAIATRADDMTATPLTLEAIDNTTINISNPLALTIEYSVDEGATWTASAANPITIPVTAGDKVSLRGDNAAYADAGSWQSSSGHTSIKSTGNFYAYGNVMSLISSTGFASLTALSQSYTFPYLFGECYDRLRSHPSKELLLPATTLTQYCYARMFSACTEMRRAPSLPAQSLTGYCYYYMFTNCSSLRQVRCLAVYNTSSNYATYCWLLGVSSTGTLIAAPDMSGNQWKTMSNSGSCPSGWTVVADGSPIPEPTLSPGEKPLTLEAEAAGTVSIVNPNGLTMEYSLDGTTWTASSADPIEIALNQGDKVRLRGSAGSINDEYGTGVHILASNNVMAYGNMMSLISGEVFADKSAFTAEYGLAGVFCTPDWSPNTTIRNHPTEDIVLPSTSVPAYGYAFMFNGCEGITRAPALPAMTLGEYCYDDMFAGCTSLETAPALPATDLSNAEGAYTFMFNGCTSLVNAPALPATTLGNMCYDGIFMGCTSLTEAPALPAVTLVSGCYSEMFMGCTSLETAPKLRAATLADYCYSMMFSGCSSLNRVECLATDISAEGCTLNWLEDVAPTGTFITKRGMTGWPTDSPSGIPEGWTAREQQLTPMVVLVEYNGSSSTRLYFTNRSEDITVGSYFTPEDEPTGSYYVRGVWKGEQVTGRRSGMTTPAWGSQARTTCYTVVYEPSFAEVQPTNLYGWYHNFTRLNTIIGAENLDTSKADFFNNMCYNCTNLRTIDVSHFDTSNATRMDGMFYNCTYLSEITGLENFDTRNVESMSYMFYNCRQLAGIESAIAGWNTANCSSFGYMFYDCRALGALDLSGWNTANVTGMGYMFYNCYNITTLDVNSWNTAKVTSMEDTFYGCKLLTTIDVSRWDTGKVTNIAGMFFNCTGLTSLDVSRWNTINVTNFNSAFRNCSALTTLDVSRFDTRNATQMISVFLGCSGLTSLDLSNFYTSNVTSMGGMFNGCKQLQSVTVSNLWTTANVTSSGNMFTGCTAIVGEDGTTLDTNVIDKTNAHYGAGGYLRRGADIALGTQPYAIYDATTTTIYLLEADETITADSQYTPEGAAEPVNISNVWYGDAVTKQQNSYSGPSWSGLMDATVVKILPSFASVKPTSTAYWFYFYNMVELTGLENLDTSDVTDMHHMFGGAQKITSLDVSSLDTGKVTDMGDMFFNGFELTEIIGLDCFDTSHVTNFGDMFYGCQKIESLDVSGWDTSSATRMISMFEWCSKLQSLDLTGWDFSKVITTSGMFRGCYALEEITGVENFDMSSNTYVSYMFDECRSLKSLDLSAWDTSKCKGFEYTFYGCESLSSLDVSNWDFSSVDKGTSYYGDFCCMFTNCLSLGSLDLSTWDTGTVTDTKSMFSGCTGLQAIFIGDGWDMSNVTDSESMFYNCKSIVGQDGTTYDEANTDVAVAHADEGGYLRDEAPFDAYTLATVLTLDEGNEYHVSNALRVVAVSDDNGHAYVTDEAGTWARLDMDATGLTAGNALVNTIATLDNGTTAPALNAVTATPTGDITDVESLIAAIDLAAGFDIPAVGAVVKVTGYYFDGTLRGWHDNSGQSLTLATDYSGTAPAFVNGNKYTVTAALELKEPWSAAPRRARSSFDYDFQNLIGQVISSDATVVTGITDVKTGQPTEGDGITYDLQGRRVADPTAPGIYIRDGRKFIVR
ncbi:MAG: BspA family leucine-rich repeat surface protein [Muribaculaceae bacterium]|nr:BspA family leucine-rich repeat surface protein [Muribaculaceae bacterium]